MIILSDKPTVYFDVDSTLVFSYHELEKQVDRKQLSKMKVVSIDGRPFIPHEEHVETIRDFKARGHNVVVWSAGGAAWAATVVFKLGLDEVVDLCINKPDWYFDDLPVNKWMPKNIHYYKKVINE